MKGFIFTTTTNKIFLNYNDHLIRVYTVNDQEFVRNFEKRIFPAESMNILPYDVQILIMEIVKKNTPMVFRAILDKRFKEDLFCVLIGDYVTGNDYFTVEIQKSSGTTTIRYPINEITANVLSQIIRVGK